MIACSCETFRHAARSAGRGCSTQEGRRGDGPVRTPGTLESSRLQRSRRGAWGPCRCRGYRSRPGSLLLVTQSGGRCLPAARTSSPVHPERTRTRDPRTSLERSRRPRARRSRRRSCVPARPARARGRGAPCAGSRTRRFRSRRRGHWRSLPQGHADAARGRGPPSGTQGGTGGEGPGPVGQDRDSHRGDVGLTAIAPSACRRTGHGAR